MSEGRRHTDNIVRGNYHEEGEEMRLKNETINGNLVELFKDERIHYFYTIFLNKVEVGNESSESNATDVFDNLCKALKATEVKTPPPPNLKRFNESANNQMKTDVIG